MKFSDERDLLAWFKPIDKVGSNISFFFFNKSVSVKAKGAQEYTGQIKRAQNKKQEKGYTKKNTPSLIQDPTNLWNQPIADILLLYTP